MAGSMVHFGIFELLYWAFYKPDTLPVSHSAASDLTLWELIHACFGKTGIAVILKWFRLNWLFVLFVKTYVCGSSWQLFVCIGQSL